MKVAILGTRGIPNHYGGFEQLAEYLSAGLTQKGHQVSVYCSSLHPYQKNTWNQVNLIHCNDPENKLGTFGQFIYDFNCIRDSRKRDFDIILQLGYTSNSIWHFLLPEKPVIITNMDGLEWKRSKYSAKVQRFLKYAEKLAVKSSDVLVADSIGIQEYLKTGYNKQAHFIAYGADVFTGAVTDQLKTYGLPPFGYYLAIARFEPENNIESIIRGYLQSGAKEPLLLIGSYQNKYGTYLKQKYNNESIRFLGAIYDIHELNNLRYYCRLYFHGHTVGGTNPSLLEAMASQALICANQNVFNAAILGADAFYFTEDTDITKLIQSGNPEKNGAAFRLNNLEKIKSSYTWPVIIDAYEQLMINSQKK